MQRDNEELAEHAVKELARAGARAVLVNDKYSYTIVANVADTEIGQVGSIAIKVSYDSSGISNSHVKDLMVIYKVFKATPLLISETKGDRELQDGVMYSYGGIPQITLGTLRDLVHGKQIMFRSEGGVIKARIKGDLLRKRRLMYGLSLGDLAEVLSVSRKAVYEYERGLIDVSAEKAQILIELFGEDIVDYAELKVDNPSNAIKDREVRINGLLNEDVYESYILTHTHGRYAAVTKMGKVLVGSGNVDKNEALEVSNMLGARYIEIKH